MKIPSSILRAYDIRGVAGETLTPEIALHVGKGFATEAAIKLGKAPTIAVARDGRVSSPALCDALIEGIISTGADVVYLHIGPTPMLYFSQYHLDVDAGVMVTGSHNPPHHNGFKMSIAKKSFFGDAILGLGERIDAEDYHTGAGHMREQSIQADYVAHLASVLSSTSSDIKAVWDPGNGAAGDVLSALLPQLPGEHHLINAEIDGNFPNHHPDPTVEKNLVQLREKVAETGADVGLAFDGDADRIGAIDGQGRVIWGDQLMIFFAESVLKTHPGSTIIADVKASNALFDRVKQAGGQPLMWQTGHSLIKSKLAETGAALAGEMSGHIFFNDENPGYDDGIYAALRLLRILAESDESLSTQLDALPQAFTTPEIRIEVEESRKFAIIDEIKQRAQEAGADISEVDGVRVTTQDGWWLVRASNTQSAITLRAEGNSEEALSRLTALIATELNATGVAHSL